MNYPENQCPGCGSLPDDPEEDRVPCDFCGYGVACTNCDGAPDGGHTRTGDCVYAPRVQVPTDIGERAMWLFLFCACSYFFFQICRWALTGFRILGVT